MITVTYPTVQQGATGEIVVQLQTFLSKAGSSLQIDGKFGPGTRSAVKAFQRKYGIANTGVVESETWTKLLEIAGNIKVSEPIKEPMKYVTLIIPRILEKDAEELMKRYPGSECSYN